MSLVTFVPVEDCEYSNGWPEKVIGDGSIYMTLWYTYGDDLATYRDQFREEYEFSGNDSKWTVDVREDG